MRDLTNFVSEYLPRLREAGITQETDEEKVCESLNALIDDIYDDFGEEEKSFNENTLVDYLLMCVETHDVYATDFEGLSCKMYLELVQELSKGEVIFENISTCIDEDVENSGKGTGIIKFDFKGKTYKCIFEVNYDWFDDQFMSFINNVLSENNISERVILFGTPNITFLTYKNPKWAHKIEELLPGIKTEITL